MIQDLYIHQGKAYTDSQFTQEAAKAGLRLAYGDECVLTLHFDLGAIAAGDTVMAAFDADMLFGEKGTSPMGKAQKEVTAEEAQAQAITLSLPTNTERFYEVVNGARVAVPVYFGIYTFAAGSDEGYPQVSAAWFPIQALPVVATLADTVVPVEPGDLYYTKQEVDAKFVANSQKGVANGVAGLDAQGKIPAGELPALPYLPTIGGTVTGAVLSTAGGYSQTIHTIPAASTTYTLVVGKVYEHSPAAAPIYTLPAVSDIYATADIAVIVVFSASALSVAFVDSQGTTIPMLRTPDISAGQTYEFECTYIAGGWRIMPVPMEVEE
jgi:hypothetical protein